MSKQTNIPIEVLNHLDFYGHFPLCLFNEANELVWMNVEMKDILRDFEWNEIHNFSDLAYYFIKDETETQLFLSGKYHRIEEHGPVLFYDIEGKGSFIYSDLCEGYKVAYVDVQHDNLVSYKTLNDFDYKKILHQLYDAVVIYDSNGIMLDVNESFCSLFEKNATEVIGQNIYSLFPHQSYANAEKIWKTYIKDGEVDGMYKLVLDSQRTKYIQFKGLSKFGEGLHLGILKDITESYISQKELRKSEKHFKELAEHYPDLIYIIDVQKNEMTYYNRINFLGHDMSKYTNFAHWGEIINPDDNLYIIDRWTEFLTTKKFYNLQYRIKNNKGKEEWVANRFRVIQADTDGSILKVLATLTTITDQVNIVNTLSENQARLTAVLESTDDLIWSIDKEGNFVTCNSSATNFFKEFTSIIPKKGRAFIGTSNADFESEIFQYTQLALKNKPIKKEIVVGRYYFDFKFTPIKSTDQLVVGVTVIARDITLRKLSEEEIRLKNFELDSFVYRASHDLRAPLRSVLGLVRIIDHEEDRTQVNHYVQLVEKSISKLDAFIYDLTNYSRNGRLDITYSKFKVDDVINEVVDNLKFMEHAHLLRLIKKFDANFEILSDKVRLSIIFQNLISNAIKYLDYNKSDSWLEIYITQTNKCLEIVFKDNGIGIEEKYKDKLFGMFYRASNHSYGSGLGLYITKQVVEKLNGTIAYESKYKEGTSFKICLYSKLN